MKTIKFFSAVLFSCAISAASYSQKTKTETFHVNGNCGMCETKIEKAAKEAGATSAEWDKDTKMITVKYSSKSTNAAKIQQGIADVGYDNVGARAKNETYDKLHSCCKYERAEVKAEMAKPDCCKDGKCTMPGHEGKDCCKKEGGAKMDCCKDGKCTMPGHDGKDCCKKEGGANMDCCKDGKCTMPGHTGKDCCKKS
jgi:copper chaperone CopZ